MATKLPKAWSSWREIAADKGNPKRLAKLAEAGIALRNERKALEAQAGVIAAEEAALKEVLIQDFSKAELQEVKTALGVVKLVTKIIYQPDKDSGGWEKIWAYILKTKAFDLLEKRLHQGACKARYEDKKPIPGVKTFNAISIKLGDAE